jgi:hypothetical protein
VIIGAAPGHSCVDQSNTRLAHERFRSDEPEDFVEEGDQLPVRKGHVVNMGDIPLQLRQPAPLQLHAATRASTPTVTQEKVDDLARRINAVYRRGTLEVVCAVGEMVIHELYDGSVETWGREGTRRASYRKLASRGDLLLSPSALCRAVAVYILCQRLGGRASWRHLTASHLQEVLALEPPKQERILRDADLQRWTVSRVRLEVNKQRAERPHARQRRLANVVRDLSAFLARHQDVLTNAEALGELDGEATDELREAVARLSLQVNALQRRYGAIDDAEPVSA